MQWQYKFNPNAEYNTEMYPDPTQYDIKSWVQNKNIPYPSSKYHTTGNPLEFLFYLLFSIVTVVFWVKFFFLLLAPLIPVSVISFEMMNHFIGDDYITLCYLFSFVVAYLMYRYYKSYAVLLPWYLSLLFIVGIYALNIFMSYFLLEVFSDNDALIGLSEDFNIALKILGL